MHVLFPGAQAVGARQRGPALRAAEAGEASARHHGTRQGARDGAQGGQGGGHEGPQAVSQVKSNNTGLSKK